jgi:hypothetical protein
MSGLALRSFELTEEKVRVRISSLPPCYVSCPDQAIYTQNPLPPSRPSQTTNTTAAKRPRLGHRSRYQPSLLQLHPRRFPLGLHPAVSEGDTGSRVVQAAAVEYGLRGAL